MQKEAHAAGTFVVCGNKFLILHRNKEIPQGDTWGLPGGKVEEGEPLSQTVARELYEETGYRAEPSRFEHVIDFPWQYPEWTLHFHTFRLVIDKEFVPTLAPKEHSEYKWVTPLACYRMKNLIAGFYKLLEHVYPEVIGKRYPREV